jgi:DNA-binding MarR family transcriptional regulator
MDRDFFPSDLDDPREAASSPDAREPSGTPRTTSNRQLLAHDLDPNDPRTQDLRTLFHGRDRAYRLRASEMRALIDLGKFRVIAAEDIAKYLYGDRQDWARQDLRNLAAQGLVRRRTFQGPDASPRVLLTLTRAGEKLLRANRMVPRGQAIYSGFVKPKEANHDADIYQIYQKEAARIEAQGGKNLRVILDFELKRKLNRDFATLGTELRDQIAARHSLRVVDGKIPIPDLRIEYDTPAGDLGRVDLELATEHYRPRQLTQKVRAGFSLYAFRGEADRLRRVLEQRELTAEILSL